MARSDADPGTSDRRWLRNLSITLIAFAVVLQVYSNLRPTRGPLEVPLARLRLSEELRAVDHVPISPGDLAGANVLLVTLDTTRADRLHFYGNDGIRTPVLDGLARDGIVFQDAHAVAPTTLPAHASILTGLYPYHHLARINGSTMLPNRHVTLAEVLSQNGYRTAGFVSSFVLDSRFGLAQGFEIYDESMTAGPIELIEPQRDSREVTLAATGWLRKSSGLDEKSGQPFFVWVHYMDPHSAYSPPSPYAEEYAANPYDGEIAFVDEQLGNLISALDPGVVANTLIIVVADHGEGLGHHDESSHGLLLHEASLRIPLIFRLPGKTQRGLKVTVPVSQVDIMPTVLSLLGIEAPSHLDGVDLTTSPDPGRALFAETLHGYVSYDFAPLAAVYRGGFKYVHGPSPKLYDRASDPLEKKNLYSTDPAKAAQLLAALHVELGPDLEAALAPELNRRRDREEREKLRALGYIEIGEPHSRPSGGSIDPDEMIQVLNEIIHLAVQRGDDTGWLARIRYSVSDRSNPPTTEGRIARLEAIAEEHPTFLAAHRFLAYAYQRNDQPEEARRAIQRLHAASSAARLRQDK